VKWAGVLGRQDNGNATDDKQTQLPNEADPPSPYVSVSQVAAVVAYTRTAVWRSRR